MQCCASLRADPSSGRSREAQEASRSGRRPCRTLNVRARQCKHAQKVDCVTTRPEVAAHWCSGRGRLGAALALQAKAAQ